MKIVSQISVQCSSFSNNSILQRFNIAHNYYKIILLLLVTSASVNAQNIRSLQNDFLTKNMIKGPVKEIYYRTYMPHYLNKEQTKYHLEPYDFLGTKNIDFYFDISGDLLKKVNFIIEENQYKVISTEINEYHQNKIIKNRILVNQSNDTLENSYLYTLDSLVIITNRSDSLISFKSFKRDNNLEYYYLFNRDSICTETSVFEYDSSERLRRQTNLDAKKTPVEYIDFQYAGNTATITKQLYYSFKNDNKIVTEYVYDEFGNIEKQYAIIGNKKRLVSRRSYKYDRYNNWIEMETFNGNNILVDVVVRQITYY